MLQDLSRRNKIVLLTAIILFVGLIILLIITGINNANKNQFGNFIKIQNYDQKVKNVSKDVKDAVQTTLYNIVAKNSAESFNPGTVKDALIREGSDSQKYDSTSTVYSGEYIIDIESIKQSYQVQYSYSRTNTLDVGGSPIVFRCLPESLLKYGAFDCKDFVTEQGTENDDILQYLPYENFSYKITPDATGADGKLALIVTLTIPQGDLTGDVNSRSEVIALHKKEVTDWLLSKGIDPARFKITYNYTDTGELITN